MLNASQRLRILVIDDDPDQRFLHARTLEAEYGGTVQIVPAGSFEEARSALVSDVDCILLDLSLPDAQGVAAVEQLRSETSAAIIVVTGRDDLGVRCLLAGAQDYLRKGSLLGPELRHAIDGAVARSAAVREQSRLATIVQSAPDAMFVRALDGSILTWNAAAEEIFGYERDEIVGKHYYAFVPPSHREAEAATTELLIQGRKVPPYEAARVRKDGTRIDVSVTLAAIKDDRGHVVGISHIARDITQDKSLRRERDLLAGIVNSSLGAIMSIDADGVVTSWNAGAERLFGYSARDAIGRVSTFLAPDEKQAESRELSERLRRGEEVIDFETLRACKDGHLVDVVLTASPITDRDGTVLGAAVIYHDVTERKRLEEQLIQSQKMEALGGLAGGVAHDFNNLLAVILNYGRFIHEDLPEDHPARSDIEEMMGAAKRGATLVRQLLSFARREVVRPEPINLNLLIGQMQPLLDRAVAEDIVLETRLSEGLWSVKADKGQIEQLLLNLAVNARDAMPSGGRITIETSNVVADEAYVAARPNMAPGRYVSIIVSDTGTGMDRETQARIFEPFFTTKPRGSGTGLGLASVYGIVQRAEGDISVYSEPGIGTTFKIYLPTSDVSLHAVTPPDTDPASLAGRGERVLVVEDEPAVLELITRILDNNGYEPVPMASPHPAVEYLEAGGEADVLLTDVIMPEMSGRALSELTTLPTVFMSGYTDSVIAQQGVLQEGVVFLPKPFSANELLHVIRTTLDRQVPIDLREGSRPASLDSFGGDLRRHA